ncbi:MAG: polyketide synthase dehydratase domain-containing protein [Desulfopila sp.]|jgi:hypothetical protein|nr:polyketide synthase dehydratase domain-containing protein [Desulfopila sp.]
MSGSRIGCTIEVHPWYKDHFVGNTVVLPAVETMLLLADHCRISHPEVNLRIMKNLEFQKFLKIPPQTAAVEALVEYESSSAGQITIKLLSQMRFKKMTRIKEHGRIVFSTETGVSPPAIVDTTPPAAPVKKISAAQIYAELVPFGPAFHTLQDTLFLTGSSGWGRLLAPELPFTRPVQELLGSPFPLDGAMHAACVLGQQMVDFVPFPVGFAQRTVWRPTQAGADYLTRVIVTEKKVDELVFDVDIFNAAGHLFENITGLRMRNSGKATMTNMV